MQSPYFAHLDYLAEICEEIEGDVLDEQNVQDEMDNTDKYRDWYYGYINNEWMNEVPEAEWFISPESDEE